MWGRERPHILADKNLGPFISYLQDCAYFGPYILYILVHFYFLYRISFYLQIFTAIFSVSRVVNAYSLTCAINKGSCHLLLLPAFLLYHDFNKGTCVMCIYIYIYIYIYIMANAIILLFFLQDKYYS